MEDNTRYIVTKSLRRILPRVLVSGLLTTSPFVLGSALVAHYLGSEAMTVTALALPLWIFATVFFMGIGYGASAFLTRYLGENDIKGAALLVNETLAMTGGVALLFASLGWWLKRPIALLLGTPADLVAVAAEYNGWLMVALSVSILSTVLYYLVNADSSPTKALVGSGIKVVAYVAFSALFMGTMRCGIKSSAFALMVAECVSLLYFLLHFLSSSSHLRLKLLLPSVRSMKLIGKYVLNFSVDSASIVISVFLLNRLVLAHFSIEISAAFLILMSINDLVMSLYDSSAYAMVPLIGTFYGEKNSQGVKTVFVEGTKAGMIVSVGLMVVLLILSPWIPSMFSYQYTDYLPTAVWAVVIYALSLPVNMLTTIAFVSLLSVGKLRIALVLELLNTLIVPVVIGLFAVLSGEVPFLWLHFVLSGLLPVLLLGGYMWRILRKRNMEEYLEMPGWGTMYKGYLSMLVRPDEPGSWQDYQEMTRLFLSRHGIGTEKARRCELAVGEVMEFAQASHQRKLSYVDIRLAILPSDDIRVMVKFDNDEEAMKERGSDDDRLLSLRLLRGLSSSFTFNRVLSFNTLDLVI